jgi:hypothetical protein
MKKFRENPKVRTVSFKKVIIAGMAFTFIMYALVLFAGHAQGRGPAGNISVMLEPQQIALGDSAVLTIHVSGEQTGRPVISHVDGLHFFPRGQSSQFQSINGKASLIVSYIYQVQAERPGNYFIPPVKVNINGQTKKTEPISLSVLKAAGVRAGTVPLPPPGMARQARTSGLRANDENQVAFLRVTPSKYRSYVGEMVPVEIKAYFRQGLQATLNSFPVLSNNAFACQSLNQKPRKTEEVIDGDIYTVLTWFTAMSAVKEGKHPVSGELDVTLLIPESSSHRHSSFGRSIFDDDFFNSFFSRTTEKAVKLTSPRQKMRVLPLPVSGRPKDFGGAVGRFRLSSTASPKSSMVGDPITIKISVKGTGNFDRVSSPVLSSLEGWKTYTPVASFKPADSAGYKGKKQFEQAIIPLDASIKKIPALTFSYFDTGKGKYVTLRTSPVSVNITPASYQAKASSLSNHSAQPQSLSGSFKKTGGLAPIHVDLGPVMTSLRPILNKPWFIGAQGISLGVLFVGLFLGSRNRRLSNDPTVMKKKKVKQKVSSWVKEMDRAVAGHDVPVFFNACRSAAQERLGEIWCLPPETITLADVKERLSESAGIRHVFETADAVAYSGRSFSQDELRQCRDLVIEELKNMGK